MILIVFSTLFLIYCRTGAHNLHEQDMADPSAESTQQHKTVQIPAEPEAPVESVKPPRTPDLTPLIKLKKIEYNPQVLRGVFWKESHFGGEYFLTFDDGPNRRRVPGTSISVCESILNSLAAYEHKAVFFVNGKNLEYKDEEEKAELRSLLLRIIEEGHLLGNHSYSHHNLARGVFVDGEHDRQDIEDELVKTQMALDNALGFSYPLLLVRPPYAEPGRTETLDRILSENGQYLISLQFDSYDYAYKEDGRWNSLTIGERVMSLMEEQKEGGVLLLHELDSTARMLPGLLENIRSHHMSVGKLEDHLYNKYGRRS